MKVGLVPMSAKPYHAGHHWLVEKAANENDHVIVFVSISDRTRKGEQPIYGEDMQQVWKEEIEGIMPPNVEVRYGGAPVQKVYQEIQDASVENSPNTYFVYSDANDTLRNYPEKNRVKYMDPLYSQGQVRFPAEENPGQFTRGEGSPDVSGTAMRHAIQTCDINALKAGLPPGINADRVYNILCSKFNEDILRAYVGAIISG